MRFLKLTSFLLGTGLLISCGRNTDTVIDTGIGDTETGDTDTELPKGDLAWAIGFGGDARYTTGEMGRAVIVLEDGSMIVGGAFGGTMILGKGKPNETTLVSRYIGTDLFLARFAPDSSFIWAKSVTGTLDNAVSKRNIMGEHLVGDYVSDVVLLHDGSIGVVGHYHGTAVFGKGEPNETSLTTSAKNGEGFVARYLDDGSFVWARRLEGVSCWPASPSDGSPCFGAPLADGAFVVSANFWGSATISAGEKDAVEVTAPQAPRNVPTNILIAGYDQDGALKFGRSIGRNVNYMTVHAMAPSRDGGFYLMADFMNGTEAVDKTNTLVLGPDNGPQITLDCSFREPDYQSGDNVCLYEFLAIYDAKGDIVDMFVVIDNTLMVGAGLAVLDDGFFITGRGHGNDLLAPQSKKSFRVPGHLDTGYVIAARFSQKGEIASDVSFAKGSGQFPGLGALPDGSIAATGWFTNELTFNDEAHTHLVAPPFPNSDVRMTVMTARFSASGKLLWAKALWSSKGNGHQGIDLAVLSPTRFVTTGYFWDDLVFNHGEPTEKTLKANGDNEIFLAVYE